MLGYRSDHNPADAQTERELRDGNYNLSILEKYDVLLDTPIPAVFAQLDECWPDSKFILTVRPIDPWINSTRDAGFNQKYARPKNGSVIDFYNNILFGCSVFNEDRYRWVYETHHKNVERYFSGAKADQLLIMNFDRDSNTGWKELCEFLGQEIPDQKFPHENKIESRYELGTFQKRAIDILVKSGVDYRWLRRNGTLLRNKWSKLFR